jgi:hypothetical protein
MSKTLKRAKGFEPSTFTLATPPGAAPNDLNLQEVTDSVELPDSAGDSAPEVEPVIVRLDESLMGVIHSWADLPPAIQQAIVAITSTTATTATPTASNAGAKEAG